MKNPCFLLKVPAPSIVMALELWLWCSPPDNTATAGRVVERLEELPPA